MKWGLVNIITKNNCFSAKQKKKYGLYFTILTLFIKLNILIHGNNETNENKLHPATTNSI